VNVVFLSPHVPPNHFLYGQRLREAGATVLGIADAPYDGLRPELRAGLTEYCRVHDPHSTDQLRAGVSHSIARHGAVDRGDDVIHDWPWWRKMLPHDLERLGV
jgi:hypothetical protein